MAISPLRRSTRARKPINNDQVRTTRRGTVFGRVTKRASKPRAVHIAKAPKKKTQETEQLVVHIPTSPVSQEDVPSHKQVSESHTSKPVNAASPLSLSFHPDGPPLGREEEFNSLTSLLNNALQQDNQPCAVYVCGTPGTGKTLTVSKVLKRLRTPLSTDSDVIDLISDCEDNNDMSQQDAIHSPKSVWVNCAHLGNPKDVFDEVAQSLGISYASGNGGAHQAIRQFATTSGPRVVVVLDEVDFLASRDQLVLYATFEWPRLPSSRLVVVGIANSIDLPVRMLPWLRANNCMPEVVSFTPYTSKALQAIVEQRVQTLIDDDNLPMLSPVAMSLAAKKVAAGSGDARLVLDVCREADVAVKRQGGDKSMSVSLVASLLNKRGGVSAAVDTIRQLPVQQQLALCVAANAVVFSSSVESQVKGKKSLNRKATLGGLYDSFVRMCSRVKVPCVPFNEFADICCNALVHHSLLEVTNAKAGRGKTAALTVRAKGVRLRVPIEDVRAGIADRGFLPLLIAQ